MAPRPAEAVRTIVEAVGSASLEAGIHMGVVNLRGVTWRGAYEGGKPESLRDYPQVCRVGKTAEGRVAADFWGPSRSGRRL